MLKLNNQGLIRGNPGPLFLDQPKLTRAYIVYPFSNDLNISQNPLTISHYIYSFLSFSHYFAGNFFNFYGELLNAMSKNVDLIDLSGEVTRFKNIIHPEGKLIYEKTAA